MNAQTAELALNIITIVASIVWLSAAVFVWAARKRAIAPEPPLDETSLVEGGPGERVLSTSAEIEGNAADLEERATKMLVAGMPNLLDRSHGAHRSMGPVKIINRDNGAICFESLRSDRESPLRRGEIRFTSRGSYRTLIEMAFVVRRPNQGLIVAALIVNFLGLFAIAGLHWLLRELVIPHPQPAVRGQVFQMFQVVHILWPPFLLAGLYRHGLTQGERSVEATQEYIVHNLPHFS